ncbi:LysR family transcriptional regulator [Pseudomonas putida]|uniref:LysR family transcriptional regulator n=1 Tax=Pseudomonas putida TaxID=303 RepID=UPI003C6E1172
MPRWSRWLVSCGVCDGFFQTEPKINYDIPDLRAFAELARTGGFNRAADALSITPSALSRRIAKLEAAVGGDLVARSTRDMALTTLGKRLWPELNRCSVRWMTASVRHLESRGV